MLSSIDLHDKPNFKRYEIDDIWTYRYLSTEFDALYIASTQTTPQKPLGVGGIVPKITRVLPCVGAPQLSPPPCPSPVKGEGT